MGFQTTFSNKVFWVTYLTKYLSYFLNLKVMHYFTSYLEKVIWLRNLRYPQHWLCEKGKCGGHIGGKYNVQLYNVFNGAISVKKPTFSHWLNLSWMSTTVTLPGTLLGENLQVIVVAGYCGGLAGIFKVITTIYAWWTVIFRLFPFT